MCRFFCSIYLLPPCAWLTLPSFIYAASTTTMHARTLKSKALQLLLLSSCLSDCRTDRLYVRVHVALQEEIADATSALVPIQNFIYSVRTKRKSGSVRRRHSYDRVRGRVPESGRGIIAHGGTRGSENKASQRRKHYIGRLGACLPRRSV